MFRPIEIPFGDRDPVGEYTLMVDDIVEFNIATDRRDKLQRATNIVLSEHTFFVSKEEREKVLWKITLSNVVPACQLYLVLVTTGHFWNNDINKIY